MTIAISLKVNDGVILGSDSASTLIDQDGEVRNVYNNANKVFNLRKGLPIGAITWGSGAIGAAAISTLAKDLRKRFMKVTTNAAQSSTSPKYPYQAPRSAEGASVKAGSQPAAKTIRISVKVKK